jgi:pantoate--beta-alanine ligase
VSMRTIETIADMRTALATVRERATVGLVPTMGNLHEGHLSLVEASRESCDVTVVSVFVNPLQFGPNEDFDRYPRTPAEDAALLERAGVDFLFAPSEREMYPSGRETHVVITLPALTSILCGAHRPGHFDGVGTVVLKLFNIVAPTRAFFGQKDYQQLTLIKTICRQLDVPIEIVGAPTVRADDGLALSSRNQYLSDDERDRAPAIQRALQEARGSLERGDRSYAALEAAAAASLAKVGFAVDYVAIRNAVTLAAPTEDDRELVVLAAARLGRTRLIDNVRADLARR